MAPIISDNIDRIGSLCRRFHVRRLDAFGSAARGSDFDIGSSDVDLLVELEHLDPPDYADAYSGLKFGLESLLGRPVDLVTRDSIRNPYFRERVLAEVASVYAA
jgi:hypothetical protein